MCYERMQYRMTFSAYFIHYMHMTIVRRKDIRLYHRLDHVFSTDYDITYALTLSGYKKTSWETLNILIHTALKDFGTFETSL